jgi:hypothetical protein
MLDSISNSNSNSSNLFLLEHAAVLKVDCVVESNKFSLQLHSDDTHFTLKQMVNEDDNWNFVHTTN